MSGWDITAHAVEGARFVLPDEYRHRKAPYVGSRLVRQVLTDALAAAADPGGELVHLDLPAFYDGPVRAAMAGHDDVTLTYDMFTAMVLMEALLDLVLDGLLAHRGGGASYDYRLTLPP